MRYFVKIFGKKKVQFAAAVLLAATFSAEPFMGLAASGDFETFISGFNYNTRKEMRTNSPALVKGILEGRSSLLDIRFKEETDAWRIGFAKHIPLNELPSRIGEIPKDKVIVTACPHKDRAILAMAFLRSKGFDAKYLEDGLLGLAEYLRGDAAKALIQGPRR